MTRQDMPDVCLNCEAPLEGAFCAQCGQRAIPPYPSVREFIGDAWQELSGYDGRFARTLRALLRRPGALTQEVLQGRRARYVSPVRLYLLASVAYFLVAAVSPDLKVRDRETSQVRMVKIGVWIPDRDGVELSPEERALMDESIAEASPAFRPVLESMFADPAGFQARLLAAMPKLMFVLVPVFAGIIALFYRGRRYPQHLIFALHLHAVVFLALSVATLSQIFGNLIVSIVVAVPAVLFIAQYAIRGFRRVYGNGWLMTVLKMAGIGILYGAVFIPAVIAAMVWAAWAG